MIGLIGKSNNKGMGIMTREWHEHLPIDVVWCKRDQRTHHVEGFHYFDDEREINLDGITTLFLLETPFQNLIQRCREKGIKTILQANYEFLPMKLEHEPDLYLGTSSLNYAACPDPKVLLPNPVDTDKIPFKKRSTAHTFLHNAGTLGVGGANGTQELLEAIPLVKSDVRFLIRSQVPIQSNDERVEVRIGNTENYWDLFGEGDVFVSPQKFRAMSLPIQEAMASGMPVVCTDIKPFNEFVNFTFAYKEKRREMVSRMVEYHVPDVEALAQAIDTLAGSDIEAESLQARQYAESISWNALQAKFIELC